jgi:hypothetical protein
MDHAKENTTKRKRKRKMEGDGTSLSDLELDQKDEYERRHLHQLKLQGRKLLKLLNSEEKEQEEEETFIHQQPSLQTMEEIKKKRKYLCSVADQSLAYKWGYKYFFSRPTNTLSWMKMWPLIVKCKLPIHHDKVTLHLPRLIEQIGTIDNTTNALELTSNTLEPKSNTLELKSNTLEPKSNTLELKSNTLEPKGNNKPSEKKKDQYPTIKLVGNRELQLMKTINELEKEVRSCRTSLCDLKDAHQLKLLEYKKKEMILVEQQQTQIYRDEDLQENFIYFFPSSTSAGGALVPKTKIWDRYDSEVLNQLRKEQEEHMHEDDHDDLLREYGSSHVTCNGEQRNDKMLKKTKEQIIHLLKCFSPRFLDEAITYWIAYRWDHNSIPQTWHWLTNEFRSLFYNMEYDTLIERDTPCPPYTPQIILEILGSDLFYLYMLLCRITCRRTEMDVCMDQDSFLNLSKCEIAKRIKFSFACFNDKQQCLLPFCVPEAYMLYLYRTNKNLTFNI